MNWVEQKVDKGGPYIPDAARVRELEEGKRESLPILEREARKGQMPIEPIRFRPVKSPGIYEAEFAQKDKDLIFHFWPYGYHQAERDRRAAPKFKTGFEKALTDSMENVFSSNRVTVSLDRDVGAYFVKAANWGEHQFMSELAIKACEQVHKALGGS